MKLVKTTEPNKHSMDAVARPMLAANSRSLCVEIQKIVHILAQQGLAGPRDLVGVSEPEIRALEAFFDVSLPGAYRLFLSQFGRSAGFLSPWVAMYFDDLKEIRETFDGLVAKGVKFELPKQAFIIANFDSTFDFFVCGNHHNPEVHRVNLRCQHPYTKTYATSFTAWLETVALTSKAIKIPDDLYDETIEDAFGDLITH